jgi:hypothetical protein
MVETRSLLRVTSHGTTAYTLLHKNLEGKVGKVWLTIETVGAVKRDGLDGENLQGFRETPLGWS